MLIGSEIVLFAFTLPIFLSIKCVIALILILYSIAVLYSHGLLRHKKSIIAFSRTDKGWTVKDATGFYAATLCGSSTVTTKLCILRFQMFEKRLKRSCIIFKDSVPEGEFRRLLVGVRG